MMKIISNFQKICQQDVVLFALLPFGLDYILLITIKFYLILPGSGIYLKLYDNLQQMEVDQYVDEGFPKYCSIFIQKSIIQALKIIGHCVKYVNLQQQQEVLQELNKVRDHLEEKVGAVQQFRQSLIRSSVKGKKQ
ncbi:hypothetical protein PPERSA_11063 [Pseudocohnilembus persalinus]|uniref:Uncharacterized protein n=1 Tax=Pseudocohnilembus persalinus TaxID=266149 RepID=A0A0V0QZP4_PSEPJ|nr:hypothetical protein PPERSA_11063 [Pseudocohnilembus persalinus]|eukprot:KRX07514.1 hypothetical protein PPERSA_11063 [Pseudocohnilembus persalinus]